jgi:hypothetical protein
MYTKKRKIQIFKPTKTKFKVIKVNSNLRKNPPASCGGLATLQPVFLTSLGYLARVATSVDLLKGLKRLTRVKILSLSALQCEG